MFYDLDLKKLVYLVQYIKLVYWLHGRGHNFCLQKSSMPMAGLVYLVYEVSSQ